MKLPLSFVVLGAALLVGCSPSEPSNTANQGVSLNVPDPATVAKLQEIVGLRQRLLGNHQLQLQAGRAEDDGLHEVALAEARIQLARERRQSDLVLTEMRNLLTVHQNRLQQAEARAAVGVKPLSDVDQVRIDVLATEVRLLREQQGSTRN
jgi:hypothetical protein